MTASHARATTWTDAGEGVGLVWLDDVSVRDPDSGEEMVEGGDFEPVLELINEVPDGAVLCSHGDIIPEVIRTLRRSGTQLRTPTDFRKASVWVLQRNEHGDIVHATVWPPPL